MIIPYHDKSRKRKKKNLTKKLSIFNAYINFKLSKVSNSREDEEYDSEKYIDDIIPTIYNIVAAVQNSINESLDKISSLTLLKE